MASALRGRSLGSKAKHRFRKAKPRADFNTTLKYTSIGFPSELLKDVFTIISIYNVHKARLKIESLREQPSRSYVRMNLTKHENKMVIVCEASEKEKRRTVQVTDGTIQVFVALRTFIHVHIATHKSLIKSKSTGVINYNY